MSANEHPDVLQPTNDEVLQLEEDFTEQPVTVRVTTPVRVQQLPHKGGTTFTRSGVGAITPTRLLAADHRRVSATMMSVGQNVLFAFSMASAADPSRMALWPANVPYIVTTDTEVWVQAVTATTSVSVTTELWAEGNSTA